MESKDLKNLIKMITETDITEFSLETADEKISIKRGSLAPVITMAAPAPVYAPPVAVPASGAVPAAAPVTVEEKGNLVTSPIVGTFYRSPSPDAAPYVEVGQVVEKGQVLCIVEAMKLMNEIEAEYRCKIVRINKENAQPVEFGETLFVVEPL